MGFRPLSGSSISQFNLWPTSEESAEFSSPLGVIYISINKHVTGRYK